MSRRDPRCPCGHVEQMCHVWNANRWCGGVISVPDEAAVERVMEEIAWVFGACSNVTARRVIAALMSPAGGPS